MSATAKQMREQGSGEPRALPSPLVEQRKRVITSAPWACCLRVETEKVSNDRVVGTADIFLDALDRVA